jgi:hypothetical protein
MTDGRLTALLFDECNEVCAELIAKRHTVRLIAHLLAIYFCFAATYL